MSNAFKGAMWWQPFYDIAVISVDADFMNTLLLFLRNLVKVFVCMYTVGHKKVPLLFFIITLIILDQFYQFFHFCILG